mmetsp:Transcript_48269/g.134792  ORF Transcript_48269/g.134792 Transcript_48269/m.134792 type:complete len:109 (+) Transcript_48269:101-427(+)
MDDGHKEEDMEGPTHATIASGPPPLLLAAPLALLRPTSHAPRQAPPRKGRRPRRPDRRPVAATDFGGPHGAALHGSEASTEDFARWTPQCAAVVTTHAWNDMDLGSFL